MKNFITKQMYYFNYSTHFISKLNFLLQIVIVIGVYNITSQYITFIFLFGFISFQIFGFILDKTGLIDSFIERANRGMIRAIEKAFEKSIDKKLAEFKKELIDEIK